jgi:anaerobic selenocysteine-containing dehydrogenase
MVPDKNKNNAHQNSSGEKNTEAPKISRRTFIGVTAGIGAALTLSCAQRGPEAQNASSHDKAQEGVITESWIPSSCLNCTARCAIKVRVVNGKAVRIAGNPLSSTTEGENCPRSHVGLQVLYDPDRLKYPVKRTNPQKGKDVDPRWTKISWTQAFSEITSRLKSLRDERQAHKLLLLHGLNTISTEDLIHRFADAYGTPNIVSRESLEYEAVKAGQWMADGNYTSSAYGLEHTNYILAFGASIVESQIPLARNLRMWGKIRRERPNRAKIVVIDPRYSITAAKADQWIPINPGTDGALALAITNVILREHLYDSEFVKEWTTGFESYRDKVLSNYSPEKMAEITGVPAEVIYQTAREFASFKPSIAWRGRGATCWPNGSYTSYAIFCLNALVGSIDTPGGVLYQEKPAYNAMPEIIEDEIAKAGKSQSPMDLRGKKQYPAANMVTNQIPDSILNDSPYPVEAAIGLNCNFNMDAPGTERWNKAMEKVPYYVHISPAITEMAAYADIILPACTYLEEWAYDHSSAAAGFAELRIKQPVVEPLHESKAIADIIFELANRLGGTTAQSFNSIGHNGEEFAKYRTGNLISWDEFRQKGVWTGADYKYRKYETVFQTPSKKFEFISGNLEAALKDSGIVTSDTTYIPHYEDATFLGDKSSYPFKLITYHPLLDIRNGNQNYPWAQEIYLVMHGYGWTNFVEMNSYNAQSLGIKDGDYVWVESPYNKIRLKARVFEGIRRDVVAIASGEGHYLCGRWAKGIGVNPNEIIGVDYDSISGQSSFYNTRVKIYKG